MRGKVDRNKELVLLRDQKGWSFRQLASFFNIKASTAYEIYYREKAKQGKIEPPITIQKKYKSFASGKC